MRGIGYESRTCVDAVSPITTREDWDVRRVDFLDGRFSDRLRRFAPVEATPSRAAPARSVAAAESRARVPPTLGARISGRA